MNVTKSGLATPNNCKNLDKMLALPSSLSVASCRPLSSYIPYYKGLYFYRALIIGSSLCY